MNEQLKRRLIGAVVLVALAAIFIPMLFNGGDETEMPTFGTNLPAKPDVKVETIEVPLQIPPPPSVETRPVTNASEGAALEAEASGANPPAPPSAPVPAADPVVATAVPAPTPAPVATAEPPKPAPVKGALKPESGWVVQLGSFGKSASALGLRNKLRARGYTAFVEQQKSGATTLYRVRVGPELKREKADALKAKLEKAGFPGVVMPHP